MRFEGFSFGRIRIDGVTYEHDIAIERGEVPVVPTSDCQNKLPWISAKGRHANRSAERKRSRGSAVVQHVVRVGGLHGRILGGLFLQYPNARGVSKKDQPARIVPADSSDA